jgi:hypothetical protein
MVSVDVQLSKIVFIIHDIKTKKMQKLFLKYLYQTENSHTFLSVSDHQQVINPKKYSIEPNYPSLYEVDVVWKSQILKM